MQCSNGHENAAGQAFCGTCGARLEPAQDTSATAPADTPASATPPPPITGPSSADSSPATSPDSGPPRPDPVTATPGPPPPPPRPTLDANDPTVNGTDTTTGSRTRIPALALVGLAVVAIVVVGVVAMNAGGGSGRELRGIFALYDEDFGIDGDFDDCEGTGGYDDFSAGRDITVRDGSGDIVGAGTLRNVTDRDELAEYLVGTGEADDVDDTVIDFVADTPEAVCVLVTAFDIDDADFYEIKIGRRGELSFSRDELAADDWYFSLSLGN